MYRGACYRRLYGMCMVWLRKDIVRCRLYRQKKKRKIIRSWDWKLRVEVSMGESSLPQKTGSNDWVIEQYRNCGWTKQSWYGYSIKVKGLWNDEMQLWFNPSPLVLSQWKTCIMVTHQHICLTFLDCFISAFFCCINLGIRYMVLYGTVFGLCSGWVIKSRCYVCGCGIPIKWNLCKELCKLKCM